MKIFSRLFIIAISISFSIAPAASAAYDFQYVKVDSQAIEAQAVADGAMLSAFGGAFNLSIPAGALQKSGRIEFMELKPADDSSLKIPGGYKQLTGIYEYNLRGTGYNPKFPIQLSIPFQSNLEFNKYFLIFDQKRQVWKEFSSLTDLQNGILTATLPYASAKFAVTDLETMTHGQASWYRFKKCMCAASPDYPKGTKLLVTNNNKNQSIVVTVNDWGPERDIFPERVIDLDLVAFQKLGTKGMGILRNITVIPFVAEKYDQDSVKKLLAGDAVELNKAVEQVAAVQVESSVVPTAPEIAPTPVAEQPKTVVVPQPDSLPTIDISKIYFLPSN